MTAKTDGGIAAQVAVALGMPKPAGGEAYYLLRKRMDAIQAIMFPAFAEWLRSRWTPVGAQFNITAADLDRLDEGKAPFGMEE